MTQWIDFIRHVNKPAELLTQNGVWTTVYLSYRNYNNDNQQIFSFHNLICGTFVPKNFSIKTVKTSDYGRFLGSDSSYRIYLGEQPHNRSLKIFNTDVWTFKFSTGVTTVESTGIYNAGCSINRHTEWEYDYSSDPLEHESFLVPSFDLIKELNLFLMAKKDGLIRMGNWSLIAAKQNCMKFWLLEPVR